MSIISSICFCSSDFRQMHHWEAIQFLKSNLCLEIATEWSSYDLFIVFVCLVLLIQYQLGLHPLFFYPWENPDHSGVERIYDNTIKACVSGDNWNDAIMLILEISAIPTSHSDLFPLSALPKRWYGKCAPSKILF